MTNSKKLKQATQAALQSQLSRDPVSIIDAGSQAARAGDSLERVARYCMANMAGFPKVSKEDRAQFKDGVFVHYATVKAAEYYVREGANLIALDAKPAKFTADHVVIDVATATSMSGQFLSGLKTTDRPLYDVVTPYRSACNKYASARWDATVGCAKRLTAVSRPRGATQPWRDRMGKVFDTMAASAKVALSPGRADASAPTPEQLKKAVKAFWAALAS